MGSGRPTLVEPFLHVLAKLATLHLETPADRNETREFQKREVTLNALSVFKFASIASGAWELNPARLRWAARNGRSRPLGSAGALEMATRTRSDLLGRSRWPLEPVRLRLGPRDGRSNQLGSGGRSKWPLELGLDIQKWCF